MNPLLLTIAFVLPMTPHGQTCLNMLIRSSVLPGSVHIHYILHSQVHAISKTSGDSCKPGRSHYSTLRKAAFATLPQCCAPRKRGIRMSTESYFRQVPNPITLLTAACELKGPSSSNDPHYVSHHLADLPLTHLFHHTVIPNITAKRLLQSEHIIYLQWCHYGIYALCLVSQSPQRRFHPTRFPIEGELCPPLSSCTPPPFPSLSAEPGVAWIALHPTLAPNDRLIPVIGPSTSWDLLHTSFIDVKFCHFESSDQYLYSMCLGSRPGITWQICPSNGLQYWPWASWS